jgi:hypothetical protein
MAFKLTVYPGAPDTKPLKGERTKPGDDGIFEITCDDDQLAEYEKLKASPGICFCSVAAKKRPGPKKKEKK